MIEQTELIVTKWQYTPPEKFIPGQEKIFSSTSLEVMRKRAATKKGSPAGSVVILFLKIKQFLNIPGKILM